VKALADPSAPAREFFYLKDRLKQDAALHEPILAEGDTATAYAVSRKVAKRLGLTETQIDALMKPKLLEKEYDESKHPRGEHGRWTEGGGGGAPSEVTPPPSEKPLLIGTGTSRERLESWKQQLTAQWGALEPGSKEDTENARMLGSIEAFLRTPQAEIDSGQKTFYEVHDLDNNLLATVFSQFNSKTRAATIEFMGGLDHDAKVKALQHTILAQQENHAERIEGTEFTDNETGAHAVYEQAGFRKIGGTDGGVQRFIIGAEVTEAEKGHTEQTRTAHAQHVLKLSRDVAKDLGFDPDKVKVTTNEETSPNFTLNGKPHKAAGFAYTHGPEKGTIKLFPEQLSGSLVPTSWSDDQIKGVAAHEVEHIKYQTALDKYREESALVMTEPPPPPDPNAEYYAGRVGGPSAIMKPDGTLYPPYDKKFPNYQAMQLALYNVGWDKFRDSDGVTNYSREYWQALHATNDANLYNSAMHETLAEMGYKKYMTGKFPEHMGPADESKSKPTQAQMRASAKIWRDLYRTVEKIYQGKA
jgi:hypothetical protein